jgi:hypothetical protein
LRLQPSVITGMFTSNSFAMQLPDSFLRNQGSS